MDLKQFQEQFQKAILEDDTAILSHIPDSEREARGVLLGVYQSAYVMRLIEILESDYEKLAAYIGAEQFSDMAGAYIAEHPSQETNARYVGRHFPQFLREHAPYSDYPPLAELASLEQALGDAFDAADAGLVGIDQLAAIAPQDWVDLTFVPHPATQLLQHETNAAEIWLAINDEVEPPDPGEAPTTVPVLVWRQELTPMFRILEAEEAMLWNEAQKGVRFSVLCEMAATFDDPDTAALRAAQYLQGWIASEMIAALAPQRAR